MLRVISRGCVWEIDECCQHLLQRLKGWGGQLVSVQTIKQVAAHCIKLVCMAVVPEGSLLLKIMHKKARKQADKFAENKQTKDMDYWNNVLWSDETKINLFGSDGVKRVWRLPGDEYKDKCVLSTVKHDGGSVMIWGCMSAASTGELQFIEGTMNGNMYCDILKQSIIPSIRRLGRRAVFQHDNDPKNTSKMTTALLKKLRVKVICGASSNGRWRSARSLTSTSSVMSLWRSGRRLQWQPVKLW